MKITTIADKSTFSPEQKMNSEQKMMFIPQPAIAANPNVNSILI